MRTVAIKAFKLLNKMGPTDLYDLLHYKKSAYYFRYRNIVELPTPITKRYGKNPFRYSAARQ